MILGDKIMTLRKKNGWSQEELAEKLNVTRQSVSKWEGAQSVPDLERILQMSQLFGVTTDYLLKDELELEEYLPGAVEMPFRRVSMEEANAYLAFRLQAAGKIALATYLCILSPVCLFLLAGAYETGMTALSEGAACAIGMIVLLVMVAAAVAMFITCGAGNRSYEYLKTGQFETEYGVAGMVRECRNRFQDTYTRYNILGTCLCILSVIPLFIGAFFAEEIALPIKGDMFVLLMLGLLFVMAGLGVTFFIRGGVYWSAMNRLLQEGDSAPGVREMQNRTDGIGTIYWLVVTAIFLAYSFITEDWARSWIVWPVAGVLYGAVMVACRTFGKKEE